MKLLKLVLLYMRRYLLIPLFLNLLALPAHAATVEILTPRLQQGQTLIAKFDEQPTKVTLNSVALTAFPYQTGWRVIAPIALTAKTGSQQMIAEFKTGSVTKTITIAARTPHVIVLPVPPKLNQTPQQLVQNLATVNSTINTGVQIVTKETRFRTPFALPLANNRNISSPFGEIRQTGEERINHLGTDFVMPKGSSVAAINAGVVSKAYVDPVYGNSVIIDHGQGIYTLYLQLRHPQGQTRRHGQKRHYSWHSWRNRLGQRTTPSPLAESERYLSRSPAIYQQF